MNFTFRTPVARPEKWSGPYGISRVHPASMRLRSRDRRNAMKSSQWYHIKKASMRLRSRDRRNYGGGLRGAVLAGLQ